MPLNFVLPYNNLKHVLIVSLNNKLLRLGVRCFVG